MNFDRTRLHRGSTRRARRAALSIACLSASLLLTAPAAALASTVTLNGGVIEIVAGGGEVNRIETARSAQDISITDSVRISRPRDCPRVSANAIVCPSAGVATIRTLSGDLDDAILARNGALDEIACGSGRDVVTADAGDVVAVDCEQVDRPAPAPVPAPEPTPAPAPLPVPAPDADPILVIQPVTGPEPMRPDAALPFDLDSAATAPAASPVLTTRPRTSRTLPARLRRISATVRLAGTLTARGARIRLLSVNGAPRGSAIEVSCRGRGCPSAAERRSATSAGLRFAPFQRALGAGTVIEIAVRPASAAIGKHTRFVIRKGAAPARVDSCLMPGTSRPSKCTRR